MSESGHFTVSFSERVGRLLECVDAAGRIEFTLDAGAGEGNSICLEHHPASWPRGSRYEAAFESAKRFLESSGYSVEIYGQ